MQRIVRLAEILKILQQNKSITLKKLAEHFKVTERTIQRDIKKLRESGFPLKTNKDGYYYLDKNLIKNCDFCYDEAEFAFILGLKDLLSKVGEPFKKRVSRLLNSIYDNFDSIIFINFNHTVEVDEKIFNQLVRAITNRNLVSIEYTVHSSFKAVVEPYRLACFEGFWYLIGKDKASKIIKKYALDKIKKVSILKKVFNNVPKELDNLLRNSASIWFSDKKDIKVKILVTADCASYFKRKTLFPTQKIEQENKDGSIVVSFQIAHFEEIIHFLKSWLPWIKILEPEELGEELIEQMEEWIEWQHK
jgi:predicted DNA-binding transcriptional regulator YafY